MKIKKIFVAFLMNFFLPGGAHLYIGEVKKSFLILPVLLFIYLCSLILSIFYSNKIMIIIFWAVLILVYLYSYINPILKIKNDDYNNKNSTHKKYYFVFALLFLITNFLLPWLKVSSHNPLRTFIIPAGSMRKTIEVGDIIIAYKTKNISRGDLVIFQYPKNPEVYYLKRNIAIGGDLVAIKDKHLLLHLKEGNEYIQQNYQKNEYMSFNNKLWVINPYKQQQIGIHNDEKVIKNGLNPSQLFDMLPIQVPIGEYFVMGDNRDHSNDSRFFGSIPTKYIYGTTNRVYFNFDRLERIGLSIK